MEVVSRDVDKPPLGGNFLKLPSPTDDVCFWLRGGWFHLLEARRAKIEVRKMIISFGMGMPRRGCGPSSVIIGYQLGVCALDVGPGVTVIKLRFNSVGCTFFSWLDERGS